MIKLKDIYNQIVEDITSTQYTLYCDMDGVLVDFEKKFEEVSGGISTNQYRDEFGISAFWKLINEGGIDFWVDMDWMPDGKALFNYIKPNLGCQV